MFKTIFSFEFKRWIKGWQFYLYAGIFFFLGFFLMGSGLGFFDAVTVTTTSAKVSNTPLVISMLIVGANNLLYFLFRSEEHTSELQSRCDLVFRLLLEIKQ